MSRQIETPKPRITPFECKTFICKAILIGLIFPALNEEAEKEKKKYSVYTRPEFVNEFLAQNEVRPLKKVNISLFSK